MTHAPSQEGTDLEMTLPQLIVVQHALQAFARGVAYTHVTTAQQMERNTAHKLLDRLKPLRYELEKRMEEMTQ